MSNLIMPIQTIFLSLLETAFIVLGLAFVFGMLLAPMQRLQNWLGGVLIGLVMGGVGVVNMLLAVTLAPGIIIDIRSPLLIVAGVYGGPPAALTAAGLMAVYRILGVGGVGIEPAVGALLTAALLGIFWHWRKTQPSTGMWLALGGLSVFVSAAWSSALLPADLNQLFLNNFMPTALILYPLMTLLLGKVIAFQMQRHDLVQALSESEARFRATFNQTTRLTSLLKPDGRVVAINTTALAFNQLDPTEVIDKPVWDVGWLELYAEQDHDDLQTVIKRVAEGAVIQQRLTFVSREQKPIHLEFWFQPIRDEHGSVIMLLAEAYDVTEQVQAEQHRLQFQLEQERHALLRDFIVDASHHLRTPITKLQTASYLLNRVLDNAANSIALITDDLERGDYDQAREQAESLRRICTYARERMPEQQKTLDGLTRLITDLLELVRLEQADVLEHEPFDLSAAARDVADQLRTVTAEAQVTLELALPDAPITLNADEAAVRTVIQNLLENAAQYTPAGGTVNLRVKQCDGCAIVTVSDTGIGIPLDDLPKIYDRFYRADNAQAMFERGSGLGMAIVKHIVGALAGDMNVTSTPGTGTTVEVTFFDKKPTA